MSRGSRDLRGLWHGTYTYEATGEIALPVPTTRFELAITRSGFGLFRGTVTEDAAPIDRGTGTIRGYVLGSSIRFVKRMPIAFIWSNGRPVLFSARLAELGFPGLPERPAPPIHYAGRFDGPDQASGVWVIRKGHLRAARGVWVSIPRTTGTWTMRRAD